MKKTYQYRLYRQWDGCKVFWVTESPGNGGKDWGYSENSQDAAVFSEYWKSRFKNDCALVGQIGLSVEA